MKQLIFIILISLSLVYCGPKKKPNPDLPTPDEPPTPTTQLELKDANQLLAQKRCAEAAAMYQKFLEKASKDAGAWNLLGLALLCDGKIEQSMTAFNRALAISPTYTDVHNNLGVAYMELKNYTEARKEFMKALEDTSYPVAGPYFNLAKASYMQGNYEESRALSKKVLETNSTAVGPLMLYALSLEKVGRLNEAEETYRSLLKVAPGNLEACYYFANVLVLQNKGCEARTYYNKVVDANPLGPLGQKSIEGLKNIRCQQ